MLQSLVIALPFMVCLFWTAVLVLEWRRSFPAKHLLTIFMALSTLLYFCHMVFFTEQNRVVDEVADSLYSFCNIAVFPFYYLYLRRLTHVRRFSINFMVLLPALLIGIWTSCLYIFDAPESWQQTRMLVAKILFLAQLPYVCWFGYRDLNEFDRTICEYYADTEFRTVKRTKTLMFVLIGGALFSGISGITGRNYFFDHPELLFIPSFIFAVLLFAVGYVGEKQNFSIDDLEVEGELPILEVTPIMETIQEQTVERLLNRLDKLMEEKKLYLKHDLRLHDVVQEMGVSRTVVSNLINKRLGTSFSDFVNAKRVEHAKALIRNSSSSDKNLLTEVMEKSGFSSETSFYRAFRKHTGLTPRDWMNNGCIL